MMRAYLFIIILHSTDLHSDSIVFPFFNREISFNNLLSPKIKRELRAHANHIWYGLNYEFMYIACDQRLAMAMAMAMVSMCVSKNGHIYFESIE